jgi:hypothetical protein
MGRRKTPKPEHQGPHDLRLWAIVDSLVTDASGEVPVTQWAISDARRDDR